MENIDEEISEIEAQLSLLKQERDEVIDKVQHSTPKTVQHQSEARDSGVASAPTSRQLHQTATQIPDTTSTLDSHGLNEDYSNSPGATSFVPFGKGARPKVTFADTQPGLVGMHESEYQPTGGRGMAYITQRKNRRYLPSPPPVQEHSRGIMPRKTNTPDKHTVRVKPMTAL